MLLAVVVMVMTSWVAWPWHPELGLLMAVTLSHLSLLSTPLSPEGQISV